MKKTMAGTQIIVKLFMRHYTRFLSGKRIEPALEGKLVERLSRLIERSEWFARKWIKFNKPSSHMFPAG